MNPDDLARIEARAAAATDGPWEASGIDVLRSRGPWEGQDDVPLTAADADFIAHARTDVPALVAALREAWAERDEARAALLDKQRDYEATHREKRELTSIVVRLRTERDTARGLHSWALDERDEARAALARVEALCDETEAAYVRVFQTPEQVSAFGPAMPVVQVDVRRVRAALAGPTPTEGDDRA